MLICALCVLALCRQGGIDIDLGGEEGVVSHEEGAMMYWIENASQLKHYSPELWGVPQDVSGGRAGGGTGGAAMGMRLQGRRARAAQRGRAGGLRAEGGFRALPLLFAVLPYRERDGGRVRRAREKLQHRHCSARCCRCCSATLGSWMCCCTTRTGTMVS